MIWLRLSLLLILAAASTFGASFFSSAWKRRRTTDPETLVFFATLPGYDCSLCGYDDCHSYAVAVDKEGADPALCSPGGARLESRIRALLSMRPDDGRARSLRAVVRCGGSRKNAAVNFVYDGCSDCRSVIGLFGSPKHCKEGCVGLGSCISACPLGALRIVSDIAVVNPAICTGCGNCVRMCPTGVISLLPKDLTWYVACSSKRDSESKLSDCSAACTACGECSKLSSRSEFLVEGLLAKENNDATDGNWQEIAERCPTRAIVLIGSEKIRHSSFLKNRR